jgi:hypothetical protein
MVQLPTGLKVPRSPSSPVGIEKPDPAFGERAKKGKMSA